MNLFRLKLLPRSPWRTHWQADTLTGMLCATYARTHNTNLLREHLLEPMLAGNPPFVLSDACPGDFLPAPLSIRLQKWGHNSYKMVKHARWVTAPAFNRLRQFEPLQPSELYSDTDLLLTNARYHNTLSRLTDTTGESDESGNSGLGVFHQPDIHLRTQTDLGEPNQLLNGANYLSLYFRTTTPDTFNLLLDLLDALSETGFGADVATGRGQFDIVGDPEPIPDLDKQPVGANAIVCLSTFQPGTDDPTDGLWDAFPKFGKLGPDFSLDNADVHKRTLILFRPGACFRATPTRPFLGRAIPMKQLLLPDKATDLHARGIDILHPAFGLAVPATLSWGLTT